MTTVYVLCTYGGNNATEPYIAVFSSLGAAQRAYRRLANNGGDGSRFFIEYHVVDKPGSKAKQVASGRADDGAHEHDPREPRHEHHEYAHGVGHAATWGVGKPHRYPLVRADEVDPSDKGHTKARYTDWQYEVANGDTRLGFTEWCEHKADEEQAAVDRAYEQSAAKREDEARAFTDLYSTVGPMPDEEESGG